MAQFSRRKLIGSAAVGLAAMAVTTASAAADPRVAPPGDALSPYKSGRFSPPAAGKPMTWTVHVGVMSHSMEVSGMGFFPQNIWINLGDTVTWSIDTAEQHTVTLVTPAMLKAYETLLQDPLVPASGGSTFDNPMSPTIVNSGPISSMSKPITYSLTFNVPGDYGYTCLFHDSMWGVVHVRPAGTPYPFSQGYYDAEGWVVKKEMLRHGAALIGQAQSADVINVNGPTVLAGFGDGPVSLMRFYPGSVTVKVGKVVTWTNSDFVEPHTITFGPEPPDPDTNPLAFYNGQVQPPGPQMMPLVYDGNPKTTVHSGFLGYMYPSGNAFRVIFSQPGKYQYHCVLHDFMGMVGWVNVVP